MLSIRQLLIGKVKLNALSIALALITLLMNSQVFANSTVSLVKTGENWTLRIDGEPFQLRGAGMGYSDEAGIASLAKAGGNAFRTWGTENLAVQLAAAVRHDLKVLVGLDMQKELQGFDYNDNHAVAAQQEQLETSIERYKDHPNVLGWIIANEPNLMVGLDGSVVPPDPKVYTAMADVLTYIHKHDPDHPATVAFAFTPTLEDDVTLALQAMPDIDFLSFQGYGALPAIAPFVQDIQLEIPYMVTEFGPLGHWEMPATQWGREIEEPSGMKARGLLERMQKAGLNKPEGQLLGSFVFLWGHKQERTPTWYGLFTEDGNRTTAVDELTRLWTGQYPVQRAPAAWKILLNAKIATDNLTVVPGEDLQAQLEASDPDGDSLTVRWQLMSEVQERSHGGHFEAKPNTIDVPFLDATSTDDQHGVNFQAPERTGEYRLYAWATDGHGGVATANFPFLVKSP